MNQKKLIVITGHYGSGKTNFAVNLALKEAKSGKRCTVIDLDIVNPYFRTADFEELFRENGITLRAPLYANSNLDIPALNIDLRSIINETDRVIIDVGGDDEGAKALGRFADEISAAGYEMLYVINKYRYLTKEPEEALALMYDIERAGGLRCTGIVNNSNLGAETTEEIVRGALKYAKNVAETAGLPLTATAAKAEAMPAEAENPFPVSIYVRTMWS